MDKFSINDWTTLQTRKDLLYIRRSIESETINRAIFADLFISLFSFVMDHVLWTVTDENTGAVEQVAPLWYWIATAALMFFTPVIIFLIDFLKKKRYQADIRMVMPVDYLINLLDNEVCYNVMTADSMLDHVKNASSTMGVELKKFYFIEALYYSNKAITHLFYFNNQGHRAIQTNESFGGISYIRFENVCRIVSEIYTELIKIASEIDYFISIDESESFICNFNELLCTMSNSVKELKTIKELCVHINKRASKNEEVTKAQEKV